MFDKALDDLIRLLSDFGISLAVGGKVISSYAKKENNKKKTDGRRDIDANTGIKRYSGIREDGTLWEKVKSWFRFIEKGKLREY